MLRALCLSLHLLCLSNQLTANSNIPVTRAWSSFSMCFPWLLQEKFSSHNQTLLSEFCNLLLTIKAMLLCILPYSLDFKNAFTCKDFLVIPHMLLASADSHMKHVLVFSKFHIVIPSYCQFILTISKEAHTWHTVNFLLFLQRWALSLALLFSKNTCLGFHILI